MQKKIAVGKNYLHVGQRTVYQNDSQIIDELIENAKTILWQTIFDIFLQEKNLYLQKIEHRLFDNFIVLFGTVCRHFIIKYIRCNEFLYRFLGPLYYL